MLLHTLCWVMDILSSHTNPWMHLEHLCHLGFCLSCWQRDPCVKELNNSYLKMPPGVCSKLIMYWHLYLLQTKANPPVPMLKAMWALSIHRELSVILASSTAWCPRTLFSPSTIWIPTLFLFCGITPCLPLKSHIVLNGWGPRLRGETARITEKALRAGTVLCSCLPEIPSWQWGSSIAPLLGSVRGHTALWDFQILQGWDCMMTRAGHLFITSPLQVLVSKNCSAGNNSSFTEPMVLWTLARHLFFHPLVF